ncbi:hypothetical protein [Algiphilus aromaticivorans]|uniref:hypothetical protein n=1 Tax=Algiphilus aromaticivorans TaxID=382454 RepID=UPI0005C14C5B|nr:hypothetical protein [Algiphilus aromaticivorans]
MHRVFPAAGLAVLLTLTSFSAIAGGWARIASEGENMKLEYGDAALRMSVGGQGEDAYLLIRDGKIYSVTGGVVIDATSMMERFGNKTKTPGDSLARFHGLEATGRNETVAGISGEVHVLDFTDHNGRRQQKEVVLSDDQRVVEMQRAFLRMTKTMADAAGTDTAGAADFEAALGSRGVLRMGNEMRVAEISGDDPGSARLELPSKPMSFGDFGGAFGK